MSYTNNRIAPFTEISLLFWGLVLIVTFGAYQPAKGQSVELEFLDGGLWTYINDACADGDIVYASNPYGWMIINYSNPATPDTLFFEYLSDGCDGVAKIDNYLYIVGSRDSLIIYNVVDSYNPIAVPGMAFGNDLDKIYFNDTLAFISGTSNSLQIINVADPANPFYYSTYTFSDDPRDVVVSGDYLLAACSNYGVQIIDISNPNMPDSVSGLDTPGYCYGIDILGSYAYVADQSGGLIIVNISDMTSPSIEASYDNQYVMTVEADDPYLYIGGGTYTYLTSQTSGYLLDTLGTFDPVDGSPLKIFAEGSRLTMTMSEGILLLVDISTPASPLVYSGFEKRRFVRGLYFKDNIAYVTNYNGGMFTIDYSNPENLVELGKYENLGGAFNIIVQDTLAIIACWSNGIYILNVADPSNLTYLGYYNGFTDPTDIFVDDTLLYVTRNSPSEGYQILSIADPTSPTYIGEYATKSYPNAIFVQDTLCYVADGDSGLLVTNVSDLTNPTYVSSYPIPNSIDDLFIQGDRAYVGEEYGSNLIYIIDISEPTALDSIATFYVSGGVEDLKAYGDYVYVANQTWAQIYDIVDPKNVDKIAHFRCRGIGMEMAADQDLVGLAGESGFLMFRSPGMLVDLNDDPGVNRLPVDYSISNNYPNPFNPLTSINYSLSRKSRVTIEIYNVLGQKVITLIDANKLAGEYQVDWNGKDSKGRLVSTGIYFYKFQAGDFVDTKKMLLLK